MPTGWRVLIVITGHRAVQRERRRNHSCAVDLRDGRIAGVEAGRSEARSRQPDVQWRRV